MSDYQVGVIRFNDNSTSLRLMRMVDDMEKDRLSGWNAYFKKDYECEELKKKLLDCKCGCKPKKKRL